MQKESGQIAERIKGMREIFGITMETLAKELAIPIETYRDYEAARQDIPVGVLYKLAHRFNVELSSFLTGEEPRLETYALTRKGKGVSVERRADYHYQSLAYNFKNKKAEIFIVTVDLEEEDAPINFNSHPGQEFNYVLEGALKVVLGESEIILHEGDSLFYDSGVNHAMRAVNGKPAKFLAIIM